MPTPCTALIRFAVTTVLISVAMAASPSSASAQGFGVGARMAWVTPDSHVDGDRVRFNGGQVRLVSSRWGLEVAMDRHSEEFPSTNQKLTETPIQASLLMRLGRGRAAPFLLAGPGWYRRKVAAIDGSNAADVTSTEFGWHGGVGLEISAGRHVGIHGDYRYTFLDFNGDDKDGGGGIIGRFLPGHRGSMWTLGATLYF